MMPSSRSHRRFRCNESEQRKRTKLSQDRKSRAAGQQFIGRKEALVAISHSRSATYRSFLTGERCPLHRIILH